MSLLTIQNSRYYVDLDSIPPRATLVHPADGVSQGGQSRGAASISLYPLPTINATITGNSSGNVQTNGTAPTSAQQLYASGMTSNSSHFTSTSLPIAHSIIDKDATPADSTSLPASQASPPLPPTSVSKSEHVQLHYRPRRSREKHEMNRPLSSLPLSEALTGQTLYNPAVQTSSMPTSGNFKPRGPRLTRNASLRSSYAEGHEFRKKPLPPIPVADGEKRNSLITISTTPHSQLTNLYSGITEDNIFLMPAHGKISSTEQRAILIDEVTIPLTLVSPSQRGLHQKPSSPFTRSTEQVILQPRPIKPLQGLPASFQDQIRLTSRPRADSLEDDQLRNDVNSVKQTPLLRRFTTATSFRRPIREDNCRPSRPSDEDSSWTQILDTSLDESFVVVDDTQFC